jgi:hypothetical protein
MAALSRSIHIAVAVLALAIPVASWSLYARRRRRTLKRSAINEVVDLTLAFGPAKSPADVLRNLADVAERLEMNTQDIYGSSEWLAKFESQIANYLGKPAALFLPSGTMAQQIMLCIAQKIRLGEARVPALPQVRRPFFAHVSSHLLLWEQESHQRLLGIPCLACGDLTHPLNHADLESKVSSDQPRCREHSNIISPTKPSRRCRNRRKQIDAAMDAMSSATPCAVILEVIHVDADCLPIIPPRVSATHPDRDHCASPSFQPSVQ